MTVLEFVRLLRCSLIYQVREFFANSSLHGVKYITAKGGNIGLKLLWFCFTTSATVAALIIILSVWEKFQTEPTITGVDNDFPSDELVFPTVVVCPTIGYDAAKLQPVIDELGLSDGHNAIEFLSLLGSLSLDNMAEAYNISLPPLKSRTLRELAFDVGVQCEQVLKSCQFRGRTIDCCSNYVPFYAEKGLCFAFNTRYKSTAQKDVPVNASHLLRYNDRVWGVHLVPQVAANIYLLPYEEIFVPGFYPHLHGAWTASGGDRYDVRISKRLVHTTNDCRALNIDQRGCIFAEEVRLKYYDDSEYVMSACINECRIQLALHLCNCNPSFYKIVDTVAMCAVADFPCLFAHRDNITNLKSCVHCKPNCERAEIVIESIVDTALDTGVAISILIWPNFRNKTEILFGFVDLLVAFGGIASLFIGLSLLSCVEIFYYFTLRACCALRTNREELYELANRKRPPPLINMSLKIRGRANIHTQFMKVSNLRCQNDGYKCEDLNALQYYGYYLP